jgi:hypothetical protein
MNANDLEIREGLMQRMKDHPKLDTTHFIVEVSDGHVHLKGKADTEKEKDMAEQMAKSYPGVVSVRNDLHIDLGIIHAITSIVSEISASNEEELHHKPAEDGKGNDKKEENPRNPS